MIGQTNAVNSGLVYYLGTGTKFDVSNIPGYEKFTKDNFIVDCGTYSVSGSGTFCGSCSNSGKLTKSYNASTGILTISGTSISKRNSEVHNAVWSYGEGFSDKTFEISIKASRSPQVWLCRGKIQNV